MMVRIKKYDAETKKGIVTVTALYLDRDMEFKVLDHPAYPGIHLKGIEGLGDLALREIQAKIAVALTCEN